MSVHFSQQSIQVFWEFGVNPLSPNIQIQILQTDLYTFH